MLEFDGFDWDDGNWPKCGKHGVSKDEIEAVFRHATFSFEPAPPSPETRWIGIGMGPITGKWVLVVFTMRGPEPKARPVSARFMHNDEVMHRVRK
jgi:uncharacterized DUF497 family protein